MSAPLTVERFATHAACILVFTASVLSAQFRGAIQGTVIDITGAAVPRAKVTITNNETQRAQNTVSSGEGFYHLAGLAPGTYTISASANGFKTETVKNVVLAGEQTQGINLSLEPGIITESVNITDTIAPALQTENANVSSELDTEAVRVLPQIGRDPYNLVRLAPGVFGDASRSGTGQSNPLPNTTGPGGSNFSIFQTENQVQVVANGQRLSQNNFEIDGVSVNSQTWGGAAVVTPNQESIKTMYVSSENYNAEFGRNSGAQVAVVSQNGTNQFHGSGVFKYNDPIFNAYNRYGGSNGAPPVRVNDYLRQFAASIGGPIRKDKLFFFFSYEGLRDHNTDYQTSWVETPQFRQQVTAARPGSVAAQILQNPGIAPRVTAVLNTPCPSGFAPGTCQQVAGGLDILSLAGARGVYQPINSGNGLDGIPDIMFAQIADPNAIDGNQYNGRIDFNPTSKDTVTFSTYFTHLYTLTADPASGARPLGDIPNAPLNSAMTLTYNHTLSAKLLNEARLNFTRFGDNQLSQTQNVDFGIPRLEVQGLPLPDRIRFGPPQGDTTPANFAENTYEFRDNVSNVVGSHAFKFGVEARYEQNNDNLAGGARPLYVFNGLLNLANDTPTFEQINANPLTGAPAPSQRYFRTGDFALFAQDEWKLRPGLTFTLGLRWEYFSPLSEKNGQLSNLQFASPYSLVGAKVVPVRQLTNPDYDNFAPRLGFAYNPQSFKNFVMRGGFGMYYTRVPDVLYENTRGNPPFFARYGICCGDQNNPYAGGQILYALGTNNSINSYPVNPLLATGLNPATNTPNGIASEVWGTQSNFPTGYAYIYSYDLQYNLPFQAVADLGYQGSTDHHLIRIVNQQFLYPSPSPTPFTAVYFPQPDVNSNYNGLNLRVARNFTSGFGLEAKYTWSKSIDEGSYEGPGAVTNQTYPQDLHSERGPSDFDVTHLITISGQYEAPWYKNQEGFLGKLLGGFQLAGIYTWHTGFPYTVKIGQSVETPGGPTLGPIRPTAYYGGAGMGTSDDCFITNCNFPKGGAAYFNVTAAGPPGIGRNSFRGPSYANADASIIKQTKLGSYLHLGENAVVDVRANIFNVFNTRNLAPFNFFDPGIFADSPQFGYSTQPALAGRVVEFQVRLSF